jgi:shikimate dehydrogenase
MSQFYRFALVGDPVTHSRSPQIHQAALSLAGLEGNYRAITADRVLLERALSDLASGVLKGVNVTMPLKRAAYELCDETTSEARDAGSVNTLRAENGAIRGHSTDAVSFKDLFDREDLKDLDSFLILGAGGSAAAAVSVAGERSLYVSARDEDQAHALVEDLDAAAVIPWGTAVVGALVINATPLGMSDERLPNAVLDVAGGLVDLPYGGGVTPAVFSMSERGCPVVDGFEFLARQAAESFHWWTGVAVDFAVLTEIARNV